MKYKFLVLGFLILILGFGFTKIVGEVEEMENYADEIVVESSKVKNQKIEKENPKQEVVVPNYEEKEEISKKYIGRFELTAYCPCKECSGGYGRTTATGKIAKQGRTVAVDPTVIPYGTKILIGDKTYIAEDCGGAVKGKIIDIFFESHEDVERFGRQKSNVFVLED